MLGVYVHLPFCPYICPYCDFAKWPLRASQAQRYLHALLAEVKAQPRADARTIFLGGGTPNAYGANDVATVLDAVRERLAPHASEVSVEINPDCVAEGDFERYRKAGVTRISVGVQSFVLEELAVLGRRHTPQQAADSVIAARESGIEAVNLDLMFGVPGQSAQSWLESLARAIELPVSHLSVYGLTIEENTPYAAWQQREPSAFSDDATEAELYGIAIDTLTNAGFEQYEISNFARPGYACRHNANYWENGEYIGLGVGAASYRSGVRSAHTRDFEQYCAAALGGAAIPGESECLEGARRVGEAAMLALRTAQGVRLHAFEERYGIHFLEYYKTIVNDFAADGLLEIDEHSVRLTRRGRFVANDVCAAFVGRV